MPYRYKDWKKGLFYMETCEKPNTLDVNNAPIKVRWDDLKPAVKRKIEMAQKAIMENAIRLRLDELKVDFKKRYNCSMYKKKLLDEELIDLGFVLFGDNPDGVKPLNLPDGTNQYKLKINYISFEPADLNEIRKYTKQKYLNPHPDANPGKDHLVFHSEAIRKITRPALPPFAIATVYNEYNLWLKLHFNASVDDEPPVFTAKGFKVFTLYSSTVVSKDRMQAFSHFSRLYQYLEHFEEVGKTSPTEFLRHLKNQGTYNGLFEKHAQLKISRYNYKTDSEKVKGPFNKIWNELM
jgi:hypothetical protein